MSDEHLGYWISPVIHASGEVADSVDAAVDMDISLPRTILQIAGIRVARGAGDVSAQLVVCLRA